MDEQDTLQLAFELDPATSDVNEFYRLYNQFLTIMTDAGPSMAVESPQLPKTKELKGTEKRDSLVAKEKKYQKIWADSKIFEANPPSIEEYPLGNVTPTELREKFPNWMGTMAFPYQNGRLHAGHVFSVSKVEFGAGVKLPYPQSISQVTSLINPRSVGSQDAGKAGALPDGISRNRNADQGCG